MKSYLFHFIKQDNAPADVKSSMNENNWSDDEQAKQTARAYLAMMQGNYKRVDIYVKKGTMWQDSGLFVELSDL